MKNNKSKKTYSNTQQPTSHSPPKNLQRKSLTQVSISDMSHEEFELRIMDVDIKKPRSAYSFYIKELKDKLDDRRNITEFNKEYSSKWPSLSKKEKEKYEKLAAEDKLRFQEHSALVRKFILSKPLKESATAFNIFIDEQISEAIENEGDIKEARTAALEKWKNMTSDEKDLYEDKKEKHRELYEDIKKAKTSQISAYTLFCKDKMMKARDKGQTMTLKKCAELWKSCSETIKVKYETYADEVREERIKNRDLYEIAFNIKPKRPLGPYNFFLMELAKQGKFKGMKEASKIWDNCTYEEKEKYQKIAKKAQLAYLVKKAEYNSHMRTYMPRAKSAFNIFVSDMKGKMEDVKFPEGGVFEYCYNKWKKLDDATKRKYQKEADQETEDVRKLKEENSSKIFDLPKKPLSGYNRYVKERVPILKQKHEDKEVTELFGLIGQEWKKMKDSAKDKYNRLYEDELSEYKEKMKEYKDNGYYTPVKSEIKERKKSKDKSVSKSKESTKKGKTKN